MAVAIMMMIENAACVPFIIIIVNYSCPSSGIKTQAVQQNKLKHKLGKDSAPAPGVCLVRGIVVIIIISEGATYYKYVLPPVMNKLIIKTLHACD